MKATYLNRYGDNVLFEEFENEVHMSGFNLEWMRYGWENVYTEAYNKYVEDVSKLEEPDTNLLIDDPDQNGLRKCTLEEFKEFVHEWYEDRVNPLSKYRSLIVSDHNDINMVDPSGGPYITKGTNIGRYFSDKKDRIVKSIKIEPDKVIFKIK